MLADAQQRRIRYCFHVAVAQSICSQPRGSNGLRVGNALLDLRANGTVVDKRSTADDLSPVVNGYLRILKESMRIQMPDAQLRYLAGRPRNRCLMTLSAGLRVVEWAQTIGGNLLDFFEELLVGLAPVWISKTIALIVVSCDRLLRGSGNLST